MTAKASLDSDLVTRIRARLTDEWRRTGDGDWMRMPKELRRRHQNGGIMGAMIGGLLHAYEAQDLKALKPVEPLGEKAVAKVEGALGFALPADLRQLYREIGDGGFGPFNGIRRLANWARDYEKLLAEPIGQKQRAWPAALLPIVYLNGQRICMDRESGAILRWTKPPSRCSEAAWSASFAPQAETLQEWLERWVDIPTAIEGGPDGGWLPSDVEVERRERAEAEKQARIDAAAEKARSFTLAELPALPEALLEQVRSRAQDPQRRTYLAGGAARSTPFGADDLEDELIKAADAIPGHAFAGLAGLLDNLRKLTPLTGGLPGLNMVAMPGGGMVMMKPGSGGKLGAPATPAAFAHAAERLGFLLPRPLQQLYAIADGGFGPGDRGLFSLAELTDRYRKLNAKPPGPSGEAWPAKLLPLYESDPALGCLDLESGRIIVYDPSRMEDIHGGYWRRSFACKQESLAAMIEDWLGSPTLAEQVARREGDRAMRDSLRERAGERPHRAFGDPRRQAEAEIAYYRYLSPEMRAEHGLPETGWENEIRRRHGLI